MILLYLILIFAVSFAVLFGFIKRGSRGVRPVDPAALIKPMPPAGQKNADGPTYLLMSSVRNARDLGGYVTADGAVVRSGLLFRTGALAMATDDDLEQLAALGLRQIFDLRSDREVAELPDRVPSSAEYHHLPIQSEDPARGKLGKLFFERSALADMMQDGYVIMLEERAERFGAVLVRLANPENLPALFHCTAGKDRVGITTALLLGLLDVPKETIIADYAQSNRAFDALYADFKASTGARLQRLGIPFDDLRGLLVADPAWIEGVLDHIDQTYGSIEAYLLQRAGLSQAQLEQIRVNLLD